MIQRLVVALALLVTSAALPAFALLTATPYVTGLSEPVGMVQDPADPTVQYVVEQQGRIRVIQNGFLLTDPYINFIGAGNPVQSGGEQGLLGLALPPDYATSGRAYVYFNNTAGDIVVSRFTRSATNPLTLDPLTRFDLEWAPGQRFIPHPTFGNHNGGKLAFGPDGFLYLGPGDGGSGGDPNNNAQNPNTLLGKILRIDVNVPADDTKGYRIPPNNPFVDGVPIAARGEIWDFGVRNPWRFTFDSPALGGTGALIIADVGQSSREEVSFEPAGRGGRNYGWALREGREDFNKIPPATAAFIPLTEPIFDYDRSIGGTVTGGYIYRGTDLGPTFRGRYFLADYISQRVFSFLVTLDGQGEVTPLPPPPNAFVFEHTAEMGAIGSVSSIDVDARGELYFVSHTQGTIFKVVLDTDHDTLPDGWEMQFGLSPTSAAGNDGAAGDPDSDGRTNAQELAAGTHPRNIASLTRFLAEGSSSSFFETTINLANPNTQSASVLLQLLRTDGVTITQPLTIPPLQHMTVHPGVLAGLAAADFSTVAETDREVVMERTMTWTRAGRFGSHSERAVSVPSTAWFLAEGATHGAFDTFYLLENPSDTAAQVQITYLLPVGSPLVMAYTVGPRSRRTIWVDQEDPTLGAADVSASINVTNGVGIIVERAMYRTSHDTAFMAGHDSAGVTAPSQNWFFAEGATGGFFDLFLLLANPGALPAQVTVRYLLPADAPVVKTYQLSPQSRFTVNVELEHAMLAGTAVSMVVEADQPIVAERAMYWPGPSGEGWLEAHNSPGATETGTAWVVAGGELGGLFQAQTYVLIANTSAFAGRARVTLLREGEGPLVATIDVAAGSRTNIDIAGMPEFAAALNSRFGVLVESLDFAEIVVERATYSNDSSGTVWSAGSNALATRVR
jgi:glucose/arabinose dehydrogenase